MNPKTTFPVLHKIPVYEVRLVQSRRPLRLAESCINSSLTAAKAFHALIGLTDRTSHASLSTGSTT